MGNILFEQIGENIQFQLVDLNRMKFGMRIGCHQGCQNFERIDTDKEALCTIAEAYAQVRGYKKEDCTELVLRMRWRKHKKSNTK